MELWRSAAGMVEVELISAEPAGALQVINEESIPVWQVRQMGALTIRFRIRRGDYRLLRKLAEKRGERLRLCRKMGIYWAAKTFARRPVLVTGMVILLCLALYLPTRVLFVRVDGNASIPGNRILSAAEVCGIRFGASRREVRSERVKNALLSEVPNLQWAGVNTYGCVAVISVRERSEPEETVESDGVCSIVAVRDGVISSCTASRGNLVCSVGQAVKEGQVLISGYTDCGICIQATRAEGEIYAQTRREMSVIRMSQCEKTGEITDTKRKYSLLIGKKRINLWKDSGIWDTSCGRMYEEYYITLPGGFQLPVALVVETYTFRESSPFAIPVTDARGELERFAERYLAQQMIAGRILQGFTAVSTEDGRYRLEGSYLCHEMIGRVQQEKIGE